MTQVPTDNQPGYQLAPHLAKPARTERDIFWLNFSRNSPNRNQKFEHGEIVEQTCAATFSVPKVGPLREPRASSWEPSGYLQETVVAPTWRTSWTRISAEELSAASCRELQAGCCELQATSCDELRATSCELPATSCHELRATSCERRAAAAASYELRAASCCELRATSCELM